MLLNLKWFAGFSFVSFSLLFQGTPDQRIILTTQSNSGYDAGTSITPRDLGARLVDGPSPLAGRLQMFHDGKWRSVCTNSRK